MQTTIDAYLAMLNSPRVSCLLLILLSLGLPFQMPISAQESWTRWGGSGGDFQVSDDGIATQWPEGGPPVLWRRPLGDHGHSAILAEGNRLYTMFRRGDEDVAIAIDADTGETVWEHSYEAPLPEGFVGQFGPGPHSTPLLVGDRLYTVGSLSQLHSLDKTTGKPIWARDLRTELEAPLVMRGFGASPIAWNDLVVLPVGGQGQAIVAFRQSDGEVVWSALDGRIGYSTPVLVSIDGKEQMAVVVGPKRAGLDPASGEVLWELDLPESAATVMSTQIQVGDNLIFGSSAYADGSRVFAVERDGDGWKAEERWYSRKMGIMHQTAVQFGDYVYGSSGDFGPHFLAALDVETGELAFRARGFGKANLVRVGDKVLILDEDGQLALGNPSPEGIEILDQAEVLDGVSWTVPTVVGTRVYLRTRTEMLALDLGADAGVPVTDKDAAEPAESALASVASADVSRAPARSLSGQTLAIPAAELARGLAYYVMAGDDAQLQVTSRSPLQRTVARHNRIVGYLIAPFDLDEIDWQSEDAPALVFAAAFRLPARTLTTGSSLIDQMLHGQLLASSQHPEITFRLDQIAAVEKLPRIGSANGTGDNSAAVETSRFRLNAKGRFEIKGQEIEVEAPVELTFRRSNDQTMSRYVGDLAFLETRFEIALEDAGIEVPGPLSGVIDSKVEIDLYLAFSTVTPDKSLDPSLTQESHQKESLFLTLLRDLEDPEAAYTLAREYVDSRWSDAEALYRVGKVIVTDPAIRHRDLAFARRVVARASELRQGQHALTLNTLARIQSEMGDLKAAVATQRDAVARLGPGEARFAARLKQNLERLEARLAAGS